MDLNDYREKLLGDIGVAAEANYSDMQTEFIKYVAEVLIDAEEFDDFVECQFEKNTNASGRNMNIQIDGYSMNEIDGTCCIFISDFRGYSKDLEFNKSTIDKLYDRMMHFVVEATTNNLIDIIEESSNAYDFAKLLETELSKIVTFRFFIFTDVENKQRAKNIKKDRICDRNVELNVWDVKRLLDLLSLSANKESIEIDFEEMNYSGIPCVKAVDYTNVKADVPSVLEENSEQRIDYSSYLAVIRGDILNQLYLAYGARLLEGNVRSFLSVRGKVNKSIKNTIVHYPEMFFAYNNGIAATATDVECKMTNEGLKIVKVTDLQIVNGGQTTASITNTILQANTKSKTDEVVDVSNLYVPMKLSVLKHETAEKIIPKISEYSNSQNKVASSDFFSTHPFNIRMEKYSRQIAAPTVDGNQYRQFWLYERARGQYEQGKMKLKPKSPEMREYELKFPKEQVIKLVDLAKYMNLYEGAPHIVSKGGQENIKRFAPEVTAKWEKSNNEFNDYYFKRVVGLAIIYKKADLMIKASEWYKQKKSYKANVIAYTMAIIFDKVRKEYPGKGLDFIRIWNLQNTYQEIDKQINDLVLPVYKYITDEKRPLENVTEWCKKELCWEKAKNIKWSLNIDFVNSLVSEGETKKEAVVIRKLETELDEITQILKLGTDYWEKVIKWGIMKKILTETELSLFKIAANIERSGKIPTDKQAKYILSARDRMIMEGMPQVF